MRWPKINRIIKAYLSDGIVSAQRALDCRSSFNTHEPSRLIGRIEALRAIEEFIDMKHLIFNRDDS